MQNIKSKKGFTIIEVVLVLAIAGLIFLMVFVALPTMQRNQRDTARRNDYAAFAANITGYITNNNGNLPGEDTTANRKLDPTKYINADGTDQSGKPYKTFVYKCATTSSPCKKAVTELEADYIENKVYLVLNAKCDSTTQGKAAASSGNRDYAILGQLESGVYCQDNV